ncbi:MAG: DnaJ domain-containing protein [Actinobacteria bacterium]|nr:DnaJ domain-containing protein [Actinomycetota bacterium]
MSNHYEILGVKSSASIKEIRTAHRAMVRKLHPDANGLGTANFSLALAAVSEAWSVLGNPTSRRLYDESLTAKSRYRQAPNLKKQNTVEFADEFTDEPEFEVPQVVVRAKIPWRFMLSLVAVGALLILFLQSTASPSIPQGPDSLINSGSCVAFDSTQAVYEVSCDGPNDGVVRQLIGFDKTCSSDTFGYRDRQGMGIACLEP